MDLEKTLKVVNRIFNEENIDHALIGGMALASYGVSRATYDVDMIIDERDKLKAVYLLQSIGFKLEYDSAEVCQFSGIGPLDILLARRPISRKMLSQAKIHPAHGIKCLDIEDIIGLKIQAYHNDPEREYQDKADIQALINISRDLDWHRLKEYAELFDQWEFLKKFL